MNPALPARPTPVLTTTVSSADSFAAVSSRSSLRDRLRIPDQAMALGAAVLLPLGLVCVLLSWYGAARTPYLFEQIPYLISGGLFGLGLVVTGGFVLFGSWIARTAREQQAISYELLDAVRAVRAEIAGLPDALPSTAPTQRRRANGGGSGSLVATANGSMLHRPDCVVVAHREDVHAVTTKEAGGLSACRLCDPLSLTAAR